MIVKAIKSFASANLSCVEGETYDLDAETVKSLGGLVEEVKPKAAKKAPAKKQSK